MQTRLIRSALFVVTVLAPLLLACMDGSAANPAVYETGRPSGEATIMASTNPQPSVELEGDWVLKPGVSDEFNGETLDTGKWNNDPPDWGSWSWEPENAYVEDGRLHIRMQYEKHERRSPAQRHDTLFYTSGIVRTRRRLLHGYFEARIKAAPRYPGVCPAFWADYAGEKDRRTEIDFVELTMRAEPNIIDTNTHVQYHPDLAEAEAPLREHVQTTLPFDPREDLHVYSCLWNDDRIVWYVDGQVVRERANAFWDQPLIVTVSMGLRRPLKGDPPEKYARAEGFPTTFEVDYVRIWQKRPEAASADTQATGGETEASPAEKIITARIRPDRLKPLGFNKDSPFGVCGSAFAAEHLDRLGITWARMGVPEFKPKQAETWLETKGETFPFSDAARAVLDAGGRVLGLINFKDTATWVESGDEGYLDVVSECTRKMVEAHKDRIHHWEVINEPDVFSRGVTPQQIGANDGMCWDIRRGLLWLVKGYEQAVFVMKPDFKAVR